MLPVQEVDTNPARIGVGFLRPEPDGDSPPDPDASARMAMAS